MRSVAAEIPKNSPKNRRPVADPKFIVYADPEDPAALHALGLVAIRHGHLHHELRLALKTSLRQKPLMRPSGKRLAPCGNALASWQSSGSARDRRS